MGDSQGYGGLYIYRRLWSRRLYMVYIKYLRLIKCCYFEKCSSGFLIWISTNAVFMRFLFNYSQNTYYSNSCFNGLLLLLVLSGSLPDIFINWRFAAAFFRGPCLTFAQCLHVLIFFIVRLAVCLFGLLIIVWWSV